MSEEPPDPTRVVVDADVLAVDLLVGGEAREALDLLRAHSWLTMVLSEQLVSDAASVIEAHTDDRLAGDWQDRIMQDATIVVPTVSGHPAIAAAATGNAASVLSFHKGLRSTAAGQTIRQHVATSVKSPDAFCKQLDPERLYEAISDEPYPGPDADPGA